VVGVAKPVVSLTWRSRTVRRVLVGFVAIVLANTAVLGALAAGVIPDAQGVIHSCYTPSSGAIRIVADGTQCKTKEVHLQWNEAGPAGPAGPAGVGSIDELDGTACHQDAEVPGSLAVTYGANGSVSLTCRSGGGGTTDAGVFVATAGDDTAAGTQSEPLRTINHAIAVAAASQQDVYVSQGIYAEAISLADGVDVHGGYEPETWVRSSSAEVVITGWPIAVLADGVTVALDDLGIEASGPAQIGQSGYGIVARSSTLTLTNVSIVSGPGGAGGDAASTWSAPADAGGAGVAGQPGVEHSSVLFCDDRPLPAGGGGGSSPADNVGGRGGDAGVGASGGQDGVDGVGPGAGAGGPGAPVETGDGSAGDDGDAGVPGAVGAAGSGSFAMQGYEVTAGLVGGAGDAGSGGGGGGGGGGGTADCDSSGSTGGGGGGGGAGGVGGGSGGSGGGSFGIYAWASTISGTSVAIVTADGGAGGAGGAGQPGGAGGAGGPGGPYGGSGEQDDGGMGAPGGNGGAGGDGGDGGGGAGGPSIGLYLGGGSSYSIDTLAIAYGDGGLGGPSGGYSGADGLSTAVYP
jgi:hypothetical protein